MAEVRIDRRGVTDEPDAAAAERREGLVAEGVEAGADGWHPGIFTASACAGQRKVGAAARRRWYDGREPQPERPMPPPAPRSEPDPPRSPAPGRVVLLVGAVLGVVIFGCAGVAAGLYFAVVMPLIDDEAAAARADPPPPPEVAPPVLVEKVRPAPPPPPEPPPPAVAPPPRVRSGDGSAPDRPLSFLTTNDLVDRSPQLVGKWVAVVGRVDRVRANAAFVGTVDLVHSRRPLLFATVANEHWRPDVAAEDDEVELIGRVTQGTEHFVTLDGGRIARRTPAVPRPPLVVTAEDVVGAFDEDAEEAGERYRGRAVRVTGRVASMTSDAAGPTGFSLAGPPNSRQHLTAEFEPARQAEIRGVRLGDVVTLVGRIPGRPRWNNAVLLRDPRLEPRP